MISQQNIKDAVEETVKNVVPVVHGGSYVVDYLYRFKVGDRLPRGKRFDFYRDAEQKNKWVNEVNRFTYQIVTSKYAHQVSPFLLSQITLLSYAAINKECELNTSAIFDVIKMLEGDSKHAHSTKLTKHRIPFDVTGMFNGYEHSHVPLLPNAYLSMFEKKSVQNAVAQSFDQTTGEFDLSAVESKIATKGASKPGRMTGHWLITRTTCGTTYYLGVFPHSRGRIDDRWIFNLVFESERQLKRAG